MTEASRQRPRREGLGRTQGQDVGFIHSLSGKVSLMAAWATLFVHGDAASKTLLSWSSSSSGTSEDGEWNEARVSEPSGHRERRKMRLVGQDHGLSRKQGSTRTRASL